MYDHIIVTGNGKTSRENVEALVDDYIHANPKVKFTLANPVRLSEGQVWLKQYLTDKEVEFSLELSDPKITGKNSAMFILWDDDDPESLSSLAIAKENGIPAFDLTEGLNELVPQDSIKAANVPVIPEQEQMTEEEIEAEEDGEEDPEEFEDPLYEAVRIIADIFAEAIGKELKRALKK
jgi:hypothetical protein